MLTYLKGVCVCVAKATNSAYVDDNGNKSMNFVEFCIFFHMHDHVDSAR